jgi:hypothetical protein
MQMGMDNPAPGAAKNISNKQYSQREPLRTKASAETPMVAFQALIAPL